MNVSKYITLLKSWLVSSGGVTAVEYALLGGGVALAITASILLFSNELGEVLFTLGNELTNRVNI